MFSCELPLATSSNSLVNTKPKGKDSNAHIVRTRVILNPPNHSKIAAEFTLVPGFLSRSDIMRFHLPSFPNRQIDMIVGHNVGGLIIVLLDGNHGGHE